MVEQLIAGFDAALEQELDKSNGNWLIAYIRASFKSDPLENRLSSAFPIADGWMFACAILTAIFAWKHHSLATLFAPLTGASMIFLGLYAFTYGVNTGLLFHLTLDEIIEIAIKIYCLVAGSLVIYYGWRFNKSALRIQTGQSRRSQVHPVC